MGGDAPRIEEREFRVVISSPTGDLCHTVFCASLYNLLAYSTNHPTPNISIGFHTFGTSILPYSRERLVKLAFEVNATHMLWLDSDMEFPADTLIRLLGHDKPFVAANCIARRPPFAITGRDEANKEILTTQESTGLEKCARVGLAVALLNMDVFRAIPQPWFAFEWIPENDFEFIRGEDVRFCQLVRDAGFEIYLDHDLSKRVLHHGTHGFSPLMKDQ